MSNPVVHFEIGCRDSAKTQEFYAKLFDWQIQPMGPAAMITTGGTGINGHISALGHEPHNYVTVYVQVDDIPAALAKAEGLGGKKMVGPIDIPTGKLCLDDRSGRRHDRAFQAENVASFFGRGVQRSAFSPGKVRWTGNPDHHRRAGRRGDNRSQAAAISRLASR